MVFCSGIHSWHWGHPYSAKESCASCLQSYPKNFLPSLLRDHNILTLYGQLALDSCLTIHKLSDTLLKHENVHRYSTRNKRNIVKQNPKILGHSFLNEGVNLYNLLPTYLKDSSLECLRDILKNKLVEVAPYTLEESVSAVCSLC
ncbi:hypothetical protein WDU94_006003 [Cyamophila willieti]